MTVVRLASHKGSCSPPALQMPFLSALDGGFTWDQPAVWDVEPRREPSIPDVLHSSQDASSTWRRQKSGFEEQYSNPYYKDTKLRSPSCTGTEHSHWGRGWVSLDHCVGAHPTARCSQVRRWCFYPSTHPGEPESIHILLPPHELGSTDIYATSVVHSPLLPDYDNLSPSVTTATRQLHDCTRRCS